MLRKTNMGVMYGSQGNFVFILGLYRVYMTIRRFHCRSIPYRVSVAMFLAQ